MTVNSAAITGTGFTIVGGSLPVTLNPTQSMTLQVQFLPTVTGAASGQTHDQQQLVERKHGGSGPERYEHSRTESAVDGERCESELRQRDSEHGDDAVVDADVDGNVAGDGELGIDYGCWLYDRRGQLAGDTESRLNR